MANGLIAFAPLGQAALPFGVTAALLGAAIACILFNLLSGTTGVVMGPAAGIALVTAGVFAALIERSELAPGDALAGLAVLVALGLLSAVFQLAMAAAGLGRLVRLLPYPVVAGLINGTAALLLVSQVPVALGLAPGAGPLAGAALVAGVSFGLAMVKWPWSLPGPVGAVLVGAALHNALAAWAPALPLGSVIGALDPVVLHAAMLTDAYAEIVGLKRVTVFEVLIPAALSIAFLSSIQVMTSVAAIRDAGGADAGSRRDMLALGTANMASGVAGGMTCASMHAGTMALRLNGNRGAAAPVVTGLLMLGVLILPLPVLDFLPAAALAGVVVAAALQMIDADVLRLAPRIRRGTRQKRAEILGSIAIVLLVTVLALAFGLVVAVAAGLVLALLVFASVMAHGVLRRSYANPPGRSRIRRGPQEAATLADQAGAIRVLEIEGAVFFGNTDGIEQALDAARADGARHLILDMRRVDSIDLSGARRLVQLCERNWRAGVSLVVTPVRPGFAVHDSLDQFGLLVRLRAGQLAETLEAGLARVETLLLASFGGSGAATLDAATAFGSLGLPSGAIAALLALADEVVVPGGEALMRAGDPADAVYLLLEGTLDITMPPAGPRQAAPVYLGRLMPGALVGEMALISGAPRSADVLAQGEARCLRISAAAIATLRADEPAAAYDLLAAMARQLERNLRYANASMAALEE